MKHTLSLAIAFTVLLTVSSPVFAQTITPTLTPTPSIKKQYGFGQIIKNKIQEMKENREENRENRPTLNPSISPAKNQSRWLRAEAIIKRLRQGITSRYENTLQHKVRIEARIKKIEDTDKTRDLAAAKAKLATFNTAEYVKDLAAFDAMVTQIKASATPNKLTPELKALAKELQTDIKDLRQILAQTLRLVLESKK